MDNQNETGRKLMCIVPANMAELRAKGVESHILQRDLGGYWDEVLTVHPFAKLRAFNRLSNKHWIVDFGWKGLRTLPYLVQQLVKLARAHTNILAIKAHDPYACGVLAYIVSRAARIPYAVGVYSSYDLMEQQSGKTMLRPKVVDRLVRHWTLSHADLVLCMDKDIEKWVLRHGAKKDWTHVVGTGGVDQLHFAPMETRRNIKAEYELEGRKVVLFAGRLTPIKFPQDAVEAMTTVSKHVPDAVLVIAGDGEMREQLMSRARDLGIPVRFVGFLSQEKLRDIMYSADVILAPLSGCALVEAALSTTPIVAYDVDWHRELIEHDVNGMLVPFRDHESMGTTATVLLKAAPGFARYTLGVTAREKAVEQHSLERLWAIEAECWERVLTR